MKVNFNFNKHPELRIFTKSFDPDKHFSKVNIDPDIKKSEERYKNEFIPIFQEKISVNNIYSFSSNIFKNIFLENQKYWEDEIIQHFAETTQSANGVFIAGDQTYFYYFEPESINVNGKAGVTYRNGYVATFMNGILIAFADTINVDDGTSGAVGRGYSLVPDFKLIDLFADVLVMCVFLKYVEVETKVIKGREKRKLNIGTFKNNTPLDYKYITSNYFTNLERTGAFGVKGHWRLQRHGVGLSEVKMIWIDNFIKTGYSRQADKTRWEGEKSL